MSDPSRRAVLTGLAGFPLAAILADPVLAQAAAQQTRIETITTEGGLTVTGALAVPERKPVPALMLVHEWWGLNDQIKAVAAEFARAGYLTLAVDLFKGRVTDSAEEARALTQKVDPREAADTLAAWAQWLKNHDRSTGKVGVVGWCFGGGWALNAATIAPIDATVVYYGRVNLPAEQLAHLKGPVLGHFGRRDQFVGEPVVAAFERAMSAAGKPYGIHWYDAGHAFANPTGANYHREDAQLAWRRTLDFLAERLGGER